MEKKQTCCCGYNKKDEFLEELCKKYQPIKDNLIQMLNEVQEHYGYIPERAQKQLSEFLKIPMAEIYGVVTFYSRFTLKPKGKYSIAVCLGTACYVKGSQQVIDKFGELLNIKPGETTDDGLFTLDALRCIGACGIAPAISINGKVYPKVAVNQVASIIEEYRQLGGAE